MGHTYTALLTHIVFGTKYRQPLLDEELKPRLFAYMGGIIRDLGGIAHLINGPNDHIHILASLPPTRSLAEIMCVVKTNSSRWVHEQFPMRKKFGWQTGYGAFSVDHAGLEVVKRYIANQEEHHRTKKFHEEYLSILEEYGMEYDERYMWG